MNVDHEDLERSFERFEMPEPAFERLVDRRERRRRSERIRAGVVVVAIVLIATATFARSFFATPSPADHDITPGPRSPLWTTADVAGVVFTNPGGWHLTAYLDHNTHGRETRATALANFAPDLTSADPCAGMPTDGAILQVSPVTGARGGSWPVELTGGASSSDLACPGDHLHAHWTVNGRAFEAEATFGPRVSDPTRSDLLHAFADLSFPTTHAVLFPNMYCLYRSPTTAEVVGADTGTSPWTMYATELSGCISYGFLLNATDHAFTTFFPGPPSTFADVALDVKRGTSSILLGGAPATATRVEVRPDDGQPIDVPLIETAGVPDGPQVFVAPISNLGSGTVVFLDPSGATLRTIRFTPFMDCPENPSQCLPEVGAGQPIVTNKPGDPTSWQLVGTGGAIQLLDGGGDVLGTVPANQRLGATTVPLPGSHQEITFGVAPSALVMHETVHADWSPLWGWMPTARLADGTIVFWYEAQVGETRAVAAFDEACGPLGALDPRTGAAVTGPSQVDCLRSNGS